jgi:hypothetical protein
MNKTTAAVLIFEDHAGIIYGGKNRKFEKLCKEVWTKFTSYEKKDTSILTEFFVNEALKRKLIKSKEEIKICTDENNCAECQFEEICSKNKIPEMIPIAIRLITDDDGLPFGISIGIGESSCDSCPNKDSCPIKGLCSTQNNN